MFSLTVRDSIMIAHSLNHPFFGPAQKMHGATFTVDCTFSTPKLDQHNVVIDIGFAHTILKHVLGKLNYQNLDELFPKELTTTEFMCKHIFDRVSAFITLREPLQDDDSKSTLFKPFQGCLKVTLTENHTAWASYSGPVVEKESEPIAKTLVEEKPAPQQNISP